MHPLKFTLHPHYLPQISDLREGDLLSDLEARHCTFVHLHSKGGGWEAWPAARRLVSPVVLPAFFYAGQVQRVVDSGSVYGAQEVVLEQVGALVGRGDGRGAQEIVQSDARYMSSPCALTDNVLPSPNPFPSFPPPSLLSVVAQPGPAAGSGPGPYLRGAGGSDPGTEARAAPQECRAPAGQVRGEQAGR